MKNFFKTFLTDYAFLVCDFGVGFIVACLYWYFLSLPHAISFIICFTILAPIAYYITVYRPEQKKKLRNPLHELIIGEIMFIMHLEKLSMAKELDLKASRLGR